MTGGGKLTLDRLDLVTTAPVNAPQLAQRQNSHAARGGLFLPATETEQFRVESSQTKATSVSAGSKSTLDSLDLVTTAPVIVPHPAARAAPGGGAALVLAASRTAARTARKTTYL